MMATTAPSGTKNPPQAHCTASGNLDSFTEGRHFLPSSVQTLHFFKSAFVKAALSNILP